MAKPPPPPVKVELALMPEFNAAAPAGLRRALNGTESVSLAKLRIQASNPEVFKSASADVNEEFQPLIAAIASVIVKNKDVIGNVTVVGHTDSVPLQRSNPLSNNQKLSEARAKTIATLLVRGRRACRRACASRDARRRSRSRTTARARVAP